mmetsp:Transcript_3125/g.4348  ORF Transcript_3125/g.4348 Transcript_3125/m.4348 type:complete len:315 (+) Transcript_3125:110-1054(+)
MLFERWFCTILWSLQIADALQVFQGYHTPYIQRGSGDTAVILVHGFGSSAQHYRATIEAIAKSGRSCYALNLLGLGQAEKPANFQYGIELWSEQVQEFLKKTDIIKKKRVFLVGNSLGSLVSLHVGTNASIDGIALFNCAIGMNSKAPPLNLKEAIEWPISWIAQPIFALLDILLSLNPIATLIFDKVRDRDSLQNILTKVYTNLDRIDDELIHCFLQPAYDQGALDAFISILTGDPGPRPEFLFPRVLAPVAIFWGKDDLVTPIDGPVGKFFRAQADQGLVEFTTFDAVGHCPFDDRPEEVNEALIEWLDRFE